MAIWSSGLGLPGFCLETSLPDLWNACMKNCSYGVNKEVFLTGFRRVLVNPIWTFLHTSISQIWKARFRTKPRRTQPSATDGHQHLPPSYMTLPVELYPSQCSNPTRQRPTAATNHIQQNQICSQLHIKPPPLYQPAHHRHTSPSAPNNTCTTHPSQQTGTTHASVHPLRYTRPGKHTIHIPVQHHDTPICTPDPI